MNQTFTPNIFSKLALALVMLVLSYCSGSGNVDISKATKLQTENVPFVNPDNPNGNDTTYVNLFSLAPGSVVSYKGLGAIDPVGTSLPDDFDGDGIKNANETVSNFWVADYPSIRISIAPPVTMKVRVENTTQTDTEEIVSDINAEDMEDNKTKGAETYHQNQINVETKKVAETRTQNKTTESSATENSSSSTNEVEVGVNASFPIFNLGVKASYKHSSTSNSKENHQKGFENTYGETRDVYEDVKGKNNIDRDAKSLKSNSSATKSSKYRAEKRSKFSGTAKIKSNAGYVRAALFIKNDSVNMPVKISNILCSLMFETPQGDFIPVQSFRLRNDDYSLFSVNVYGDSEFGPYVVELDNLNTNEIENAIAKGYNPRIFIVDYDLAHVADSNYKSSLLNYSGNNVKIVEENAKGRTAAMRIFAPGVRDFFRMAAFDVQNLSDQCQFAGATNFIAGVSLRRALERLKCSSYNVTFINYLINFSDFYPEMEQKLVVLPAIESLGGVSNRLPCDEETKTGSDGISRTVCKVRPLGEWTASERENFGMWVVMSDSTRYGHSNYLMQNGTAVKYDNLDNSAAYVKILQGTGGTIWAGDHFDMIYMRAKDMFSTNSSYGQFPLISGEAVALNTLWDLTKTGENAFEPNVLTSFLGKVALGEEVELTISLQNTLRLNPNFGTPDTTTEAGVTKYSDFQYNYLRSQRLETVKKFKAEEAFDFEVSFGLGGERSNWYNLLVRKTSGTDLLPCGSASSIKDSMVWDYLAQKFTVCVKVPSVISGANSESLLDLYLRPTLNNATRNVVWPTPKELVNRYTTFLKEDVSLTAGPNFVLKVQNGVGSIADVGNGDILKIDEDSSLNLTVTGVSAVLDNYEITVSSNQIRSLKQGQKLGRRHNVGASQVALLHDNSFFTDWNAAPPLKPSTGLAFGKLLEANVPTANIASFCANSSNYTNYSGYMTTNCFGYNTNYVAANYAGFGSFDNDWSDNSWLSQFVSGLSSGSFQYDLAMVGQKKMKWNSTNGFSTGVNDFVALGNDFLISTSNNNNQMGQKQVAANDKIFIAWRSDDNGSNLDIRGRVYDVNNNSFIGNDFLISTTNNGNQVTPELVVKNDKLFIAWQSNDNGSDFDIRGRIYDINIGSFMGNDFLISTTNTNTQSTHKIAVASEKVFVIWQSAETGTNDIRGRIYDLNIGNFSSNDFLISNTNSGSQFNPEIVAANDRFFISWTSNDSGTDTIRGRVYDLSTGSFLSGDFLVSDTAPGNKGFAKMTVGEGKVFVSWQSFSNGNDDIWGRAYNLATGMFNGTNFLVSTNNLNNQRSPQQVIKNGKVFITWYSNDNGSNDDIRGRIYDFANNSFISNDFLISSTNINNQQTPKIEIENEKAIVTWYSDDNGSNYDIRGRIYDLNTGSFISSDFLISTANANNQFDHQMSIVNGRLVISWYTNDNGSNNDIRGRVYDFYNYQFHPTTILYGANNFFTAPLIERDYTVQARIKY